MCLEIHCDPLQKQRNHFKSDSLNDYRFFVIKHNKLHIILLHCNPVS